MCERKIRVKLMKSVLVIMASLTNAIAFEQIYGLNAGGEAFKDSDGIVYEKDVLQYRKYLISGQLDIGNIPKSDRYIYNNIDETHFSHKQTLKFDIPLKRDGLYVLIAKFSNIYEGHHKENIVVNNEIMLLSNVSFYNLCGGVNKICDKYFYFCVSDKRLYYKTQSTLILNEEIHIEIRAVAGWAHIAGLILLIGSLGERQKLVGSATIETLYFDPIKMHPKCATTMMTNEIQEQQRENTIQLQESIKNIGQHCFTNVTNSFGGVQAAIDSLKEQQNKIFSRFVNMEQQISKISEQISSVIFQSSFENSCKVNENSQAEISKTMESLNENSAKNLSNFKAFILSSFDNSQVTIIREIQSQRSENFNRFVNMEQQISSLRNLTEHLNHYQVASNQTERQSSIVDQAAHKDIEMLQADVRDLVENLQRIEKIILDVQAEQANLKSNINDIRNVVMSIAEHIDGIVTKSQN